MSIEDVHSNNLALIKKHGIKKGNIWRHRVNTYVEEVTDYTHGLYGWLKTTKKDNQRVPQNIEIALTFWEPTNEIN